MKPEPPADGHVFISLNSRLPLVVSTGKHLWQIVPALPVEISILAIPE